MKLYDREVSGNAYKIRLFLALLDLRYEKMSINTAAGEQRQPWYLKINPRGQIPALEVDGKFIWDSTAILIYLARRYGGEAWLPLDAYGMAGVAQWLAMAQNKILYGLARARAILLFGRKADLHEAQTAGQNALKVLDQQLRITIGWRSAAKRLPISPVIPTWCLPNRAKSCSIPILRYFPG